MDTICAWITSPFCHRRVGCCLLAVLYGPLYGFIASLLFALGLLLFEMSVSRKPASKLDPQPAASAAVGMGQWLARVKTTCDH
jgi:hypothetical protein